MFWEQKVKLIMPLCVLVVICCFVMASLCVNTALALNGSGTEQDPWRIQSLADFDEFAADANYWDDYTKLETDVNLAGRIYSTAVIPYLRFHGVFDGNDHKIIGLTIDGSGVGNIGLFGANSGEISNLGIERSSVRGDSDVGGLVGRNGGSISNCYSISDVNGTLFVGGLVGRNGGTITNCYSTSSVLGDYSVGGLVGKNGYTAGPSPPARYPGYIFYSYSTGGVIGREAVGGLVGRNLLGGIGNCYSSADVNGVSNIGGMVGHNSFEYIGGGMVGYNGFEDQGHVSIEQPGPGNAYIHISYSTGNVQGDSNVGGLVGYSEEGFIGDSFWDVQTSGQLESDGGTGLPTADMQIQVTFTDAEWDFINVWDIGENQTYPYLRVYLAGDINRDLKVNFLDFALIAMQWCEDNSP